ncbi:MAG: branched-chain amino acid ABC transporter permease [Deltaproteobacteria bacterium]|nr:branched-chain amino acid ABC transporter permease [Deltaproteobacteria bacterium]
MMRSFRKRQWVFITVFPVLALVPAFSGSYQVRTLMAFLFYFLLSQCISLQAGQAGYLNLGQGVFVGIGAYASGLLVQVGLPWWLSLILAACMGVVVSGVLGPLLFRLGKEAFAIATLALVYVCFSATNMLRNITGGTDGLSVPMNGQLHGAFFCLLFLCCSAMAIGLLLPHLRLGYHLELTGSDPARAEAVGVPARFTMGKIYALSASLLTLGGGLFMMGEGYLIPSTVFGLRVSLLPVAMAMVGGLRNPLGPLVGTAVVFGFQEWLWSYAGGMEQTLLGLLLILAGKRQMLFQRLRMKLFP